MARDDDTREATASEFIAEKPEALDCVRGWVRSLVLSLRRFDDPEATIQEILLELLCLARQGKISESRSFRPYVMTVARHTCIDVFRRRRLRERVERPVENPDDVPSTDATAEERVVDAQRRRAVRFIFQSLSADCQRLLALVFGEGLRARAAGERLGISEGNARVRLHRCLETARGLRERYWTAEA